VDSGPWPSELIAGIRAPGPNSGEDAERLTVHPTGSITATPGFDNTWEMFDVIRTLDGLGCALRQRDAESIK
jgi:hypothetical protein